MVKSNKTLNCFFVFIISLPFSCGTDPGKENLIEVSCIVSGTCHFIDTNIDSLWDYDSADGWGRAGRYLYPEAAVAMLLKSPKGEKLDRAFITALKPVYGSLVYKIRIHWNSAPLHQLGRGQFSIKTSKDNLNYQAFGYDIYVRHKKEAVKTKKRISKIIHELKHSEQFEKFQSSLSNFGYEYFREYWKAECNYKKNKLEKEAIAVEDKYEDEVHFRWKTTSEN